MKSIVGLLLSGSRPLLLLLLFSTLTASSPLDEDEDSFNQEFQAQVRDDDPRKQGIATALQQYAACREWRWSCQKQCRAQVPLPRNDSVPHCIAPLAGESCFGVPIDYKYLPSRETLPAEYEVLRRFPKCWSVLGPTLCGLIYRPCGVYEFTARLSSNLMKMEIWQRFGIGMCRRVREHCEDAIKEGFFPSELIDCKRTAENVTWIKEKTNAKGALARFVPSGNEEELKTEWDRQTVFTEEPCSTPYAENASRHEPMQCIFPLVYTMHERIAPVIDKCFLPCRNPLISSPDKFASFRVVRALLCAALAAACLTIFGFLAFRSRIFVDSDAVFSIACCLLAFSIYLIVWGAGSIDFFAEASECARTAQGVLIRNTLLESTWCWLSSVVAHVSLLASVGFLAAAYALSAAAATRAAERENEERASKKSFGTSPGRRFYVVVGVVLVSIAVGLVALGLNMVSTDGVSGVCSVGLHSIIDHLTVVALPGLAYCAAAFAWGMRDIWREKRNREAETAAAIEEKIREAVDHEKAKKKVEFWTERGPHQKEELQEAMRQGQLPPLEERTEASSNGEGGEGDTRDGEEEILVLRGDDDDEREWLSEAQKREIAETVRREQREAWEGREKRAWHEGISSRYTLLALCLCAGSLLAGLGVHYVTLANDGRAETEAVRGYVTCVMSKSIVRKDLHWLREPVHAAEMWAEGAGEADPLVRRHNLASEITIHSCAYPSTGDGRILGLLAVFLLLPLAPVAVFLWAFCAGFVGVGGMAMVKKRRLYTKKQKRPDDVEMTALNTERDEDSQMMSSVGSSSRRPGPSSTMSSAASAASGASSTTSSTSVSLRGALPRFCSAERLMTVRATSPVPSAARSERVAVPVGRSRSVGHHRVLDVMGRARERREMIRRKKKRASSAEMNSRREGVAESGQLVAPRASGAPASAVASRLHEDDDDARSVSSHSTTRTMLSAATSSYLAPPSEVGRAMIRRAEALMNRARQQPQPQRADDAGLQQQLQMVQEELVLRALPRDEATSSTAAANQQQQQQHRTDWVGRLTTIRESLQEYTQDAVYSEIANRGMLLSGQAVNLARNTNANGTVAFASNYQVLQFALDRLQGLAYFLRERLAPSPELTADIEEGIVAVRNQVQLNAHPNARALLEFQNFEISLDVNNDERIQQRIRLFEQAHTEERQAELLREMLEASNRRYVLRMVERAREARYQGPLIQGAAQQQMQQQLQPQGVGRPPVYAPMHVVDVRLPPPEGANPSSARSEASFSVTNSSVPSSALTTTHDEDAAIRMYHETWRTPPVYDGPSSSGAARAAAAPAANAAAASSTSSSSGAADFIAQVMRANGREMPPAFARQTGHFFFNGAAGSSNGVNGIDEAAEDDDDDEDDVLSSETSMDSMGRRTAPLNVVSSGGYGVPIYEVPSSSAAAAAAGPAASAAGAAASGLQPAPPVPRLFPFLRADAGNLPVVPAFPGARPTGALHATREEQEAAAAASDADAVTREERTRKELARLAMVEAPNGELRKQQQKKKRKAEPLEAEDSSSCQQIRRRHDDPPPPPPPEVNMVRLQQPQQPGCIDGLMALSAAAAAATTAAATGGGAAAGGEGEEGGRSDTEDSGIESLHSLNQHNFQLLKIGDGGAARPATQQEWAEFARRGRAQQQQRERRPRASADMRRPAEAPERLRSEERGEEPENEAGPSNESEEARRRRRLRLMNEYLNHSDPDLAMAEERRRAGEREREREEEEEEWEEKERARIAAAREERRGSAVVVDGHAAAAGGEGRDDESISSLLTAEEQIELVLALRHALEHRPTEGMQPDHRRLVEHLRLALDTQGGISRDEIMRYRVMETCRESRARQASDRNSPYSVSSVVVSRMSLAEIGARVDAIRALSDSTLYPLEVYYQLHLADVVWPLAGRDVMLGDNVYTQDEINRALGTDSPLVPAGADSDDFHQLMRKRAITAASLTGRSYGRSRGSEGFRYQPPRLPDMGLYRTFHDPTVVVAAIEGDLEPIRRAIASLHLTMPDVMRLDNRSEHTLGSHLRHFRDYLDARARIAGFELREDAYAGADAVPEEPTGSRPQQQQRDGDTDDPAGNPAPPPPGSDPKPDPEF